jgi:hypothetical protein
VKSRQLCGAHYQRWRKHGDTSIVKPPGVPAKNPTCSVDGCKRPHLARGWCNMHYLRYRRGRGDETMTMLTGGSLFERLWCRVDRGNPDACWEWGGYRQRNGVGYGVMMWKGRQLLVHRVAFFLAYGHWPNICRHRCDNPPCCNPAHLLDGTRKDNVRDAVQRGFWGRAKLTEEDVREIRRRYAAGGVTQRALADEFGVKSETVGNAISGRTWGWLTD